MDIASLLTELQQQPLPGLPKYVELREAIRRNIESGRWKPGAKLPTETELTRATPFSLGTVQRALKSLVEEGIIVRRQGHGTFVVEEAASSLGARHLRFVNDDGSGFLPVYATPGCSIEACGPGPWSVYLADSPCALRIDRVLDVNHEFRVLGRLYLDGARFPSLVQAGENREPVTDDALTRALATAYPLPVTHIAETVTVAEIPRDVCRSIALQRSASGLHMEAVARAGRNQYVYFQEFFIPPGPRRLYTVNAVRDPERRALPILLR